MPIKFVKELDTGLVLGQFYAETEQRKEQGKDTSTERVILFYHQDGTLGRIPSVNAKVIGGFRRHYHFR